MRDYCIEMDLYSMSRASCAAGYNPGAECCRLPRQGRPGCCRGGMGSDPEPATTPTVVRKATLASVLAPRVGVKAASPRPWMQPSHGVYRVRKQLVEKASRRC
jgi:hypothetical protein